MPLDRRYLYNDNNTFHIGSKFEPLGFRIHMFEIKRMEDLVMFDTYTMYII